MQKPAIETAAVAIGDQPCQQSRVRTAFGIDVPDHRGEQPFAVAPFERVRDRANPRIPRACRRIVSLNCFRPLREIDAFAVAPRALGISAGESVQFLLGDVEQRFRCRHPLFAFRGLLHHRPR